MTAPKRNTANEGRPQGPRPGESVLLEPARRLCKYIACRGERIAERRATALEDLGDTKAALELLEKLQSFAVPPGPELLREELEAGRRKLTALVTSEEAEQAFVAAGDYSRGRPVVRRHVAAMALEAKQNNPRMSRLELAERFCPCAQPEHDNGCAERLRRDTQRLNRLIREILANYPA